MDICRGNHNPGRAILNSYDAMERMLGALVHLLESDMMEYPRSVKIFTFLHPVAAR
jgi:hypothetical protein